MTHIVGGILLRHSLFSYRQRVSGLKQTVNNSVADSRTKYFMVTHEKFSLLVVYKPGLRSVF